MKNTKKDKPVYKPAQIEEKTLNELNFTLAKIKRDTGAKITKSDFITQAVIEKMQNLKALSN